MASAALSGVTYCVVCGMGSHRTDWIKKMEVGTKTYVACDNHTDQEMQKAVSEAETKLRADRAPAPSTSSLEAAAAAAAAAKKPS